MLVPNDPTVLFTPAGMNQFKREFMGLGDPSFTRATTCQKCIRTGDIENVGKTPRHMTFFEMLGNFSFGDYFKREAIHWGWEFLTRTLKIPADRLTVTVYLDDDEAFGIWNKEIGLAPDRITRMGEDDNFWPAGAPTHGPDGVCGPCSEIFYHGDGIEEVEIWNLVFTQFNRVGPGQLEPLPKKNIDTGMGLERIAAAMQKVPSNFEIDIFKPLVAATAEHLGLAYDPASPDGIRIRRISDHARALTFTIHENVKPSNEKQGYVVRRLLRRAVLDAYQMGRREPFLHQIVPTVAQVMGRPYPELADSVPRIQTVIREEEEQFLRNLENGLKLLNDAFRKTKAAGSDVDLRRGRVRPPRDPRDPRRGHREPGRRPEPPASTGRASSRRWKRPLGISRGTTEAAAVFTAGPLDALKKSYHHGNEFLGYATTSADAKVIGIVEQNRLAESATAGPEGGPPIVLVLDRTPFYGESGGQVGDTRHDPGRGVRLPGARHQEGERLHAPRRPGDRGDRLGRSPGPGRGRRRPPRGDPPGPLGHPRPAPRPAYPPGQARPAGREQGRARPAPVRLLQPRGRRPRPAPADRGDGQPPGPQGRADLLDHHADRRGEVAGGDGPLRREVPRGRPGRLDGRLLPRALRRDPPRQRRPGRPVQGRRRGVRLGRDPADHRPDRQGRAGADPPGGAGPRRRRRRAQGPPGDGPRPGRGPARRGQGPQEAGRPAQGRRRPEDLARRPAGLRLDPSATPKVVAASLGSATPDELRQLIDVLRRKARPAWPCCWPRPSTAR